MRINSPGEEKMEEERKCAGAEMEKNTYFHLYSTLFRKGTGIFYLLGLLINGLWAAVRLIHIVSVCVCV